MIIKHPEPVGRALDFATYLCSGWTCVAVYLQHYSSQIALGIAFLSFLVSWFYKHLAYKQQDKKLKAMFGEET
tara:strand:+ start:3043 stop:3261 length:219 start_codon:yes stop_codon:yes gene_type:complete